MLKRYEVRPLPGRVSEWCIALVDTDRHMLAVVSDLGNYAYLWPEPGSDFRTFLVSLRSDPHYLHKNLMAGRSDREVYDGKATRAAVEERLEEGAAVNARYSEHERQLLGDCDLSTEEGFAEWAARTGLVSPYDLVVRAPEPRCLAFCERVYPRLAALLAEEIEAESAEAWGVWGIEESQAGRWVHAGRERDGMPRLDAERMAEILGHDAPAGVRFEARVLPAESDTMSDEKVVELRALLAEARDMLRHCDDSVCDCDDETGGGGRARRAEWCGGPCVLRERIDAALALPSPPESGAQGPLDRVIAEGGSSMAHHPFSARETEAARFAEVAHASQRYGTEPYVVHLAAVRRVLVEHGHIDDDFLCAAWLHDVVEDTDVTVGELAVKFGLNVADLVWAVTGVGENRKQRNATAWGKIAQLPAALPLKLADRIANVEACLASNDDKRLGMYRDEQAAFLAALLPVSASGVDGMWCRLLAALGERS